LADETAVAIAQTVFAMIAALLPATLAAHGDHEIRALASAILPTLAPAPDLAMDVAEEDAVGARAAIALLPAGQQGRIELCTHALTQPGSIIVRWTGGSVRRDTAAALRQVRVVLDEFGLIAPISQPQEALIYG
jgi:pyrimidine deaminase RibD-like protein